MLVTLQILGKFLFGIAVVIVFSVAIVTAIWEDDVSGVRSDKPDPYTITQPKLTYDNGEYLVDYCFGEPNHPCEEDKTAGKICVKSGYEKQIRFEGDQYAPRTKYLFDSSQFGCRGSQCWAFKYVTCSGIVGQRYT
jgi:hypothetical protein